MVFKRRNVLLYKFDEQSIEVGYVLFRSLKARRHNHRPGQAALRYPPKIVIKLSPTIHQTPRGSQPVKNDQIIPGFRERFDLEEQCARFAVVWRLGGAGLGGR